MKIQTTKAYKVVFLTNTGRYSTSTLPDKLYAKYTPGTWTKAYIGGLLVFNSIENAEKAFGNRTFRARAGIELWVCECKDPVPLPRFRLSEVGTVRDVKRLWSSGEAGEGVVVEYWPEGTMAFRMVKLVECLDGGVKA